MPDINERIANLSPEKRALLERELMKLGTVRTNESAIPKRKELDEGSPLSFGQQRLWFLGQLEPDSPAYNMPKAIRLQGALDIQSLKRSLDEIVVRHEVLRTTFSSDKGIPSQQVLENAQINLPVIDVSGEPVERRETELQRLLSRESLRPFDLSNDLPLRAVLYRLGVKEHVLVITTHHIASDGWSGGVLTRELALLYEAFSNGKPSPLPELPIQYADFAGWQRDQAQTDAFESQVAYWKQQLDGAPHELDLSTDRPRPAQQTYRGDRRSRKLPLLLSESLRELSRRNESTLFMTLLAAFNVLIHRYTGQEDILVGSPIAGRKVEETESLIGLFVNNLVLRTDLSGNPTFLELLARVRRCAIDAYGNQDIPFERLVEELAPKRNLSIHPLFQVMFALQNTPGHEFELSGLVATSVELDQRGTPFDLTLNVFETDQGLITSINYSTQIFDSSTIERMLAHYEVLLEGIVDSPGSRVSHLPLLTAIETRTILNDWNDTLSDYPNEACVHELFEAVASSTPDAIALEYGEERLSYRELNQRSNQLAHHLKKLGVGSEMLVGLSVERSVDMVVGLLGVLKAGGAYLPLDPEYPRERLNFMVTDARVSVVVTQSRLSDLIPEQVEHVVCIDTDWKTIGLESDVNPVHESSAESTAYVTYTSGSTGKPKGVQISQGALVNCLNSIRHRPGITNADVLLAVTTLSFDIASLEILLPLIAGAKLVVASREEASNGFMLQEKLTATGATVMQATPATWRLLFNAGWNGSSHLKILCGGESLSRELADQMLDTQSEVWNLYGPTETTIWSALHRVEVGTGPIPIGRPIANTQIYLLDATLNPVPVGVPADIYIGGKGLANGYLNRPDLTEEVFVPNPFDSEYDTRLYKTGDIGKFLPNGCILFVGRTDDQVKLRGYRIELGEIESLLGRHPAVGEAVVAVREDTPGDQRLTAYVIARDRSLPDTDELRDFLKTSLPDYMVPSAFVTLDTLPLTPNGKVDRSLLPAPDYSPSEYEIGFGEPKTPTERIIADVWQELLGIEQATVYDNFFDLGGHSLLSMQVIARLERRLGVELNPGELIFQTLGQLASSCDLKATNTSAPPGGSIFGRILRAIRMDFPRQR